MYFMAIHYYVFKILNAYFNEVNDPRKFLTVNFSAKLRVSVSAELTL